MVPKISTENGMIIKEGLVMCLPNIGWVCTCSLFIFGNLIYYRNSYQ